MVSRFTLFAAFVSACLLAGSAQAKSLTAEQCAKAPIARQASCDALVSAERHIAGIMVATLNNDDASQLRKNSIRVRRIARKVYKNIVKNKTAKVARGLKALDKAVAKLGDAADLDALRIDITAFAAASRNWLTDAGQTTGFGGGDHDDSDDYDDSDDHHDDGEHDDHDNDEDCNCDDDDDTDDDHDDSDDYDDSHDDYDDSHDDHDDSDDEADDHDDEDDSDDDSHDDDSHDDHDDSDDEHDDFDDDNEADDSDDSHDDYDDSNDSEDDWNDDSDSEETEDDWEDGLIRK